MIAHHLYNYNSNRLTLNQGYVYKNYKTIKIIVFDKKKKNLSNHALRLVKMNNTSTPPYYRDCWHGV